MSLSNTYEVDFRAEDRVTRRPESSSLTAAGVASILFNAAAWEIDFRLDVVTEGVDSPDATAADFLARDGSAFFFDAAAGLGGFSAAAAATDARLDLRSAAAFVDVVDGVPSAKSIEPDVVAPGVVDAGAADARLLLLLVAAAGWGLSSRTDCGGAGDAATGTCLLYTSPSPRD